ncbi:hypothetical protein Prudu_443S000700, partial [Prunus dulcis]
RRRCRGRSRPEIAIDAGSPVSTLSSNFSLNSPPNRSSKASEVQPISRRNLQRVKLARTICRRSTRDPPPGHSYLPCLKARGDSAEFSAEV